MWGAICFLFLGIANLLLFTDLIIYPDGDLQVFRSLVTLVGLVIFIFGLVFKAN
jgi:hypothetical protein